MHNRVGGAVRRQESLMGSFTSAKRKEKTFSNTGVLTRQHCNINISAKKMGKCIQICYCIAGNCRGKIFSWFLWIGMQSQKHVFVKNFDEMTRCRIYIRSRTRSNHEKIEQSRKFYNGNSFFCGFYDFSRRFWATKIFQLYGNYQIGGTESLSDGIKSSSEGKESLSNGTEFYQMKQELD